MTFWVGIITGSVIGFFLGGVLGGIVGLGAGYALSLLIGRLNAGREHERRAREGRRRIAKEFLKVFGASARAAFPDLDDAGRLREVEEAIDLLFSRASADQPGNTAGDSLILTAQALGRGALGPGKAEFWHYLGVVAEKATRRSGF